MDYLNFPLSHDAAGEENIRLAWNLRIPEKAFLLPLAMPATYQDHRMIAERSCFTVHGISLDPMHEIIRKGGHDPNECLIEYEIDSGEIDALMPSLALLGIAAETAFPDLDHLAKGMIAEVEMVRDSILTQRREGSPQ